MPHGGIPPASKLHRPLGILRSAHVSKRQIDAKKTENFGLCGTFLLAIPRRSMQFRHRRGAPCDDKECYPSASLQPERSGAGDAREHYSWSGMTCGSHFTSVVPGVSKRSVPSLPHVCHAGGTTKMRVGRYQSHEAQSFPYSISPPQPLHSSIRSNSCFQTLNIYAFYLHRTKTF